MSEAATLLSSLTERGIRLEARSGGRLFVSPTLGLTAADRDALKAHKPALLALLRGEESYTLSPPSSAEESCSIPNIGWPGPGFAWRYADAHERTSASLMPSGPILVPAGVVVVYQDARPRPCDHAQAVMWCWLGGPAWFSYASSPPSFEGRGEG